VTAGRPRYWNEHAHGASQRSTEWPTTPSSSPQQSSPQKTKRTSPTRAPNIAKLATNSFPRRSSSGDTSSASQHSAAPSRLAVESLKTMSLKAPNGAVRLSQLFGDKDTVVIYSMMFGPQRERACPMCTAMLTSWEGTARNLRERVALAVTARSPIERLLDFKKERGWQSLQIYSDIKGDYTRSYVSADDGDVPGLAVFTRCDGTVRHFWSGEMSGEMADPGQDPRGAPDLDSLWTILDLTPAGRGATWYPKLEYASLTTIK
jgi:predicted dithiol-disulfide oxidoreductase (DUF899 family)